MTQSVLTVPVCILYKGCLADPGHRRQVSRHGPTPAASNKSGSDVEKNHRSKPGSGGLLYKKPSAIPSAFIQGPARRTIRKPTTMACTWYGRTADHPSRENGTMLWDQKTFKPLDLYEMKVDHKQRAAERMDDPCIRRFPAGDTDWTVCELAIPAPNGLRDRCATHP